MAQITDWLSQPSAPYTPLSEVNLGQPGFVQPAPVQQFPSPTGVRGGVQTIVRKGPMPSRVRVVLDAARNLTRF